MGIEVSSNFGDMGDDIAKWARESQLEMTADAVVEKARELGLANADAIEITFESDSSDPSLRVTPDEVRARANKILAED